MSHNDSDTDVVDKMSHSDSDTDVADKMSHNATDVVDKMSHNDSDTDVADKMSHNDSDTDVADKMSHNDSDTDVADKMSHNDSDTDVADKMSHNDSDTDVADKMSHNDSDTDVADKMSHNDSDTDVVDKMSHNDSDTDVADKMSHNDSDTDADDQYIHKVDLSQCATTPVVINITEGKGQVVVHSSETDPDCYRICNMTLVVPEENIISFVLDPFVPGDPDTYKWQHYECRNLQECNFINNYQKANYFKIPEHSKTNVLKFVIHTVGNQSAANVTLNFIVFKRLHVTVSFSSNTTGSITSPCYKDNTSRMCNRLQTSQGSGAHSWIPFDGKGTLHVPEKHWVMLSVKEYDLKPYFPYSINYYELSTKKLLTKIYSQTHSRFPLLYNISVIIEATTFMRPEGDGFKLLFSFHPYSAPPVILDSGLFDCSSTTYLTFQQHVRCNFITECENGEDERGCPYTSNECEAAISLGGTCRHIYVAPTQIGWMHAYRECRSKNLELSSFHANHLIEELIYMLYDQNVMIAFFIGLQLAQPTLPWMYKHSARWTSGVMAWQLSMPVKEFFPSSGYIDMRDEGFWLNRLLIRRAYYLQPTTAFYMCDGVSFTERAERTVDFPDMSTLYLIDGNVTIHGNVTSVSSSKQTILKPGKSTVEDGDEPFVRFYVDISPNHLQSSAFSSTQTSSGDQDLSVVRCPLEHLVLDFLICDAQSQCFTTSQSEVGVAAYCSSLDTFECEDGFYTVPYTLVCDFKPDCPDGSDESFCHHEPCKGFQCSNRECIDIQLYCDGNAHCRDESDERGECETDSYFLVWPENSTVPQYDAVIDQLRHGMFTYYNYNAEDSCPLTHFRCPNSFCVPVFLRCNGVPDCPDREDEKSCEDFVCPGFYRCRGSQVCLHMKHVCDGVPQCPQHDDERFCHRLCPSECRCRGFEFSCSRPFPASNYPELRWMNATGSGMVLGNFVSNLYLVQLTLVNCGFSQLEFNLSIPNLQRLDVSWNDIHYLHLDVFEQLTNLVWLDLSWNPITDVIATSVNQSLSFVKTLHVSGLQLDSFEPECLSSFSKIQTLNVSSGVYSSLGSFSSLQFLRKIDLRNISLDKFQRDVLKNLDQLEEMHASDFKLCCPQVLPEHFSAKNCFAPSDELSSCDNLLRSDSFRVSLCIFSVVAITGNSISFIMRSVLRNKSSNTAFPVFVTYLSLADFLMGVYLAIIGVADLVFRNSYLWNDLAWKSSWVCELAGFMSFLSRESSAFIICLITLDRFLVLKFPFKPEIHFKRRSALIAVAVAWVLSIILAAIPLTPMTSHWRFYSQSGICVPLPITRQQFPGQSYSFGIIIVLNFALFVMIAVGQAAVYWSVRQNSMKVSSVSKGSKTSENTIARRLATVVISDFLCWFPIGVLGLLASNDVPIPGEVNVAVAVVVLPLNSALNPFLYTLNALLEKRRVQKVEALTRSIEAKVRADMVAEMKNAATTGE